VGISGQLGDYTLERELGRAVLGSVFLGTRRSENGDTQSVTILRVSGRVSPAEQLDLRRQSAILTRLQHPNIVHVTEVVNDGDGGVALIMPSISHVSLQQVLTKQRLTSEQTIMLLASIADALHTAHTYGVVHGYLAPANILLTSDGKPILSGLGMTLRAKGIGAYESILNYVDPDLVDGAHANPSTDQYALGVIGYQCLTGQTPFAASTALGVLRNADRGTHAKLEMSTYGPLATVLERAIERDASQRFEDLAAFMSALQTTNAATSQNYVDNASGPRNPLVIPNAAFPDVLIKATIVEPKRQKPTERIASTNARESTTQKPIVPPSTTPATANPAATSTESVTAEAVIPEPVLPESAVLDSPVHESATPNDVVNKRLAAARAIADEVMHASQRANVASSSNTTSAADTKSTETSANSAPLTNDVGKADNASEHVVARKPIETSDAPQMRLAGASPKTTAVVHASVVHGSTPKSSNTIKRKRQVLAGLTLVMLVGSGVSFASRRSDGLETIRSAGLPECDPSVTVGCVASVLRSGSGAVVTFGDGREHAFTIGLPTDDIRVNNWFCGDRATLALYRPSTGTIYYADGWPVDGVKPLVAADDTGILNARISVKDENGDGCADMALDANGKRTLK
jgi:serine/threonine protein kinase